MMDSYAYLHSASVYENPGEFTLKAPTRINWKQLSSLSFPYFLSLAVLAAAFTLPQSAQAQIIQQGDRGSEVRAIQQSLQTLGFFNANTTGFFGPITRDAVIRFQQSRGLPADGVVGPSTLTALGLGAAPNPPANRIVIGLGEGDRGPGVTDLQNRLRELGFFNANVTGYFGPITREAVIRFQQANRIPATGLVSEETLIFLNNRVAVLPGNPVPLPSRTLRRGDTGEAVGILQRRLSQLGFYNGPINNFFDEPTERAVFSFQRAYRIQPTGEVGPTTVSFLIRATGENLPIEVVNPALPVQLGDRGTSVIGVQQRLRILGYYNGPANGIFDLSTQRAVIAFQRDRGITQTGVVGPTTQSYLVAAVPQFQPVVSDLFVPEGRPILGIPTTVPLDGIVIPERVSSSSLAPVSPSLGYQGFLRVGDRGFEVIKVQERLRDLNFYRGPISGFFDRSTENAVVRFQRANGITQTGIIGPTTRIYMFHSADPSKSASAGPSPSPTPRPTAAASETSPPSTASVRELQRRLEVQGLYRGPVDGVYNAQTEAAVNQAQQLYGSSANDVLFGGLPSPSR